MIPDLERHNTEGDIDRACRLGGNSGFYKMSPHPQLISDGLPTPLSVSVNDTLAIVLRRPDGTTAPDWVIWVEAFNPFHQHTSLIGVDYERGQSFSWSVGLVTLAH